ncbi:MAG: hypothetical protein V7K64_27835 [Nostoc sp.]|uniref:hypothetical protein n=1 Tax=unclassified Nostoc TaxID=2593658 RepID=UPI001DB7DADF|nr:hypothetical protein [Nostoc sp. JL34]MBN3886371.1 hypothetical protein [Nostoc sp. JL34]
MDRRKPLRVYALFLRFSERRSHLLFRRLHLLFRRSHLLIVFTLKQQTDEYKQRLTLNYLLSRGEQLALRPYSKIHAA